MTHLVDFWRSNNGPVTEWGQLQKAMDRLFNDRFFQVAPNAEANPTFLPSCEANEDAERYHFKFDLPGIAKENIKVEVHHNQLTVSGERKTEKKEGHRHVREIHYGSFLRTFTLPENVDPEKVGAKFENGVLELEIAKSSPPKTKQISIK